MKKIIGITAVVLFFLLLIGLLIFKLFKPSSGSTTYVPTQFPVATDAIGSTSQDPQQFTMAFYQWYITNLSKNPYFPAVDERNKVMAPWVTQSFLNSWRVADGTLEGDYVLQSGMDDPLASGTSVSTSIVSQSVRSAIVQVTVGTGSSPLVIKVEVVRGNDGAWKINSIVTN